MHHVARALAVVTALVLSVAACAEQATDDDTDADESGERESAEEAGHEAADEGGADDEATPEEDGDDPVVVTSVFALASLADAIAPGADVELLGARGQDPHDLELSPGDRAAIEDADVFLYMGDIDFQPQVEQAVQSATGEVVAVADVLGEDALVDWDHDHDDDHEHDDVHHDHGDDDDHAHGDVDPHVWLAPGKMSEVAVAIGAALADSDLERADALEEAAAALSDKLDAMETEIDERLSDCAHQTVLVGHEAWGYLLEPRGLQQEGIAGAGGHGEASPQRLAELADLIEEHGIPGVFAEPVEGRDNAEALAAEADVAVYEVNPLEVPADLDEWMDRGYRDLLMDQVATFADGLECAPR